MPAGHETLPLAMTIRGPADAPCLSFIPLSWGKNEGFK